MQTAPKLVTEGQNNSLCGNQVDMVCVWGGIKNKGKTRRYNKEGIISNLVVRHERKYGMGGCPMCLLLVIKKMRCCPTVRNS